MTVKLELLGVDQGFKCEKAVLAWILEHESSLLGGGLT
jgi:hypothetical protein